MTLQRVPPGPNVIARVFEKYQRFGRRRGFSFQQYLELEGCANRAEGHRGMDDGLHVPSERDGPDLILTPYRHQCDGFYLAAMKRSV